MNNADVIKGYKAANIAYNVVFTVNLTFVLCYTFLSLCSANELQLAFGISKVYGWVYIAGRYAFASPALKIVVPVIALVVMPCLAAWLFRQLFKAVKTGNLNKEPCEYLVFVKTKNNNLTVSPFTKKALKSEAYISLIPLVITAVSFFLLMNTAFSGITDYSRICVLVIVLLFVAVAALFLPIMLVAYIGKFIYLRGALEYCKQN